VCLADNIGLIEMKSGRGVMRFIGFRYLTTDNSSPATQTAPNMGAFLDQLALFFFQFVVKNRTEKRQFLFGKR
jgi:hypothetical protein